MTNNNNDDDDKTVPTPIPKSKTFEFELQQIPNPNDKRDYLSALADPSGIINEPNYLDQFIWQSTYDKNNDKNNNNDKFDIVSEMDSLLKNSSSSSSTTNLLDSNPFTSTSNPLSNPPSTSETFTPAADILLNTNNKKLTLSEKNAALNNLIEKPNDVSESELQKISNEIKNTSPKRLQTFDLTKLPSKPPPKNPPPKFPFSSHFTSRTPTTSKMFNIIFN
jgi:hypothetical protein